MPDWLVTTTAGRPAALSRRDRLRRAGQQAHLRRVRADSAGSSMMRAVAIQEDRRPRAAHAQQRLRRAPGRRPSRSCPRGSVRGSSSTRPSATRGDDGGLAEPEPERQAVRPERAGVERHERGRQHRAGKRAAADRRLAGDELRRGAPAGTRPPAARRAAPAPRRPGSASRAPGSRAPRSPASSIQGERGRERGERQLVGPHGARERILAAARDQRRAAPTRQPACGPPSSLSPLKRTRPAPAAERVGHPRLAG